ncbi:hypothetical protein HELRODRAFT_105332 [Helobdella robusta]|uniref:Ubiquitin carboxyl-terminal hydrolase n=1 Tax=Helobdella robusta TaxID=6412 RepID=T1EDT8_HELRO|nr:hypothetical protein HELRODRAFT_105332 [Helobdella robusta]ESO12425.1 hypothetical protein HELRODRAFT_105332 [Helobdella robusta]
MASDEQCFLNVRIPDERDRIHKDECCLSFDNAESENGLYICMNKFLAFGKRHLETYSKRTNSMVFLNVKRLVKEKECIISEPEAKKPTRLAIGFEGGFPMDDDKHEYEDIYTIVVLPSWTEYSLNDSTLPPHVIASAKSIISAESAARKTEIENLAGTWDGEKRSISKFAADLLQLNNNKKVAPSGWKCEKCDKVDNLWLNLTDGSILCGRKFFDGTGGNNHASEHYLATNYPLAVKLGTITKDSADVYSYAEDDMVEDPFLAHHLAHFGIDIMRMHKTEKTMLELELDLNQRAWEWSALTECHSQLQPIYGPGYTGMYNLGNSCYINSVVQMLFNCLPSFVEKYYTPSEKVFSGASYEDPTSNFNVQMCKLAHGLLSGEYSRPSLKDACNSDTPTSSNHSCQGIKPQMFKNLVGRGHAEFSSNKQQDAAEYMLHLFSVIERHCVGSSNPTDHLRFQIEERIQCSASNKVKYVERKDFILSLSVDADDAVNKDDVLVYEERKKKAEALGQKLDCAETVRPKILLSSSIASFASQCTVEDFYSSAINGKTTAFKTTRFKTFPEFLLIQLQKFTIGTDWLEKKLDVSVDMPDILDISHLRGSGLQPGEEELPDATKCGDVPNEPVFDENIVSEMVMMGFPLEGCKKAVYYTKSQSLDAAVDWIMEHIADSDLSSPMVLNAKEVPSEFMADEEALLTITSMGFTRKMALTALQATDNNMERAMDWIFSHPEATDASLEQQQHQLSANQQQVSAPLSTPKLTDGPGRYRLTGMISHMGSSCKCGHYVCHILKDGKWVIYNDEKVALSEKPPKDLAYLYLYQRI